MNVFYITLEEAAARGGINYTSLWWKEAA